MADRFNGGARPISGAGGRVKERGERGVDIATMEEVLACPSLPTMPAVAARILEQMRDPDVSLADLGQTVQHDQGLAALVLRTANSSLYGLRHKCTTINAALVVLGLSTVKSLALGFSLVPALKFKSDGFDAAAYWRRGLYTAVGAKLLAHEAGKPFGDEVFLGGLLQDMGVVAMHRALGQRYAAVLASIGGDHRRLTVAETAEFELSHADIGAMLATRWRMPDELVVPIKYHERPTAAPSWCADRARCIAMGNLVHDVLTDEDPSRAIGQLTARAEDWLGLGRDAVAGVVERAARTAGEMASLLVLDTGPGADAEGILRMAEEQAAVLALTSPPADLKPGSWDGAGLDGLVRDDQGSDPITGALRRRLFDTVVRSAFDSAAARHGAMSIVQVNIDGFRALVAARGMEAADEVLVATAALLKRHFNPVGGVVCRWAEDTFAVAIQGRSQADILRRASEFRGAIERASLAWTIATDARPLAVTASIGAANFDSTTGGFERGEQLMAAALRAVEASRASGGNCVRTFVPRKVA